jgi:hypothetical protein
MRLYRWYVSRKVDDSREDTDKPRYVRVVITPAKADFAKHFRRLPPEARGDLPPDDLSLWRVGEEHELEGGTTERALLEALTERNPLTRDGIRGVAGAARRIVEDMVFLQLVEDEKAYAKLWEELRATEGWKDVTPLVTLGDAGWLDYTHQARALSKRLYSQVLAASRESQEGSDAAQH